MQSVLATDIVDKDLKELRNAGWEKAFSNMEERKTEENYRDDINRKATIVIEHLIQASDISHTSKWNTNRWPREACCNRLFPRFSLSCLDLLLLLLYTVQHWHVYRKWNQKLFEELYVAYLNGRMESDPATFWYKGEFGFFDFYIIPLTKKLKDCGVFGVSSAELLNYAQKNREEWELKGQVRTLLM